MFDPESLRVLSTEKKSNGNLSLSSLCSISDPCSTHIKVYGVMATGTMKWNEDSSSVFAPGMHKVLFNAVHASSSCKE